MRRIFFGITFSAALTGSLASQANSQTTNVPRSAIPPHLAKECAANLAKQLPTTVKIVGPFSEGSFRFFPSLAQGRVVVIAAPTIATGLFGNIVKRAAGCIYDIKDGALVFRRVADPTEFPERTTRAPGDPP